MSDNVVLLHCTTKLDDPAERVLNGEAGLDQVVIVGYDKDGREYFASSVADGGQVIYRLQRGIWNMNTHMDRMSEQ